MTAPDENASREISVGRRRVNLVRLAQAQRLLLRLVLGMLGLYAAAVIFSRIFFGIPGGAWVFALLQVAL